MAKLVVLYKRPKDAEAFDTYYFATHVPIAKKIPGLRGYDVSRGAIVTPAGPSDLHLVATLSFDNMSAIKAAFAIREPRGKGRGRRRRQIRDRRRGHVVFRQWGCVSPPFVREAEALVHGVLAIVKAKR